MSLSYGQAHIDVAPGDGFLRRGRESGRAVIRVRPISAGGIGIRYRHERECVGHECGHRHQDDRRVGRWQFVRCEATEIDVVINGFGVSVDVVPDFLEGSIAGLVEDYIVEAIKDVVVDEIVPSAEEPLRPAGSPYRYDLRRCQP